MTDKRACTKRCGFHVNNMVARGETPRPTNHCIFKCKEAIMAEPVVLIYIDGDSYGADPVCFAGTGMPEVIVFDGGRYDKYNWCEGNDPPRVSHEEDLAKLAGHEAHDTLLEWIEQAEDMLGIDDDNEEDDDDD